MLKYRYYYIGGGIVDYNTNENMETMSKKAYSRYTIDSKYYDKYIE